MRKIKFRGISTTTGKFVYGCYWQNCASGETIISGDGSNEFDFYLIKKGSVGQFVGLHDCTQWDELTPSEQKAWLQDNKQENWKGKEIFEGDIIKDKYGVTGEVYYKYGTLYLGLKSGCFNEKTAKEIKVVGNIYDVCG